MKIEKVVIDSKAYDNGKLGPRAVTVRTSKGNIEAPTRSVNSSETRYRDQTGQTYEPYENPVFEYVRNHTPETIAALETKNGPMAKEVEMLRSLGDRFTDRPRLSYPRLNQVTSLSQPQLRAIADAAILAEYDLIPIPDAAPGPGGTLLSDYRKNLGSLRKYIEETCERVAIPYVDLSDEPAVFKEKVDLLLATEFDVIGLVYRSPLNHYPNFTYVNSLSDKPVWFHASGVGRYWKRLASQPHLPQRFGIDTVSIDAPKGGGGKEEGQEKKVRPPEVIKRYDSRSLGLYPKDEASELFGQDLGCNCGICAGLTLDEFYAKYGKRPAGKKPDPEYLRQVACVHEVFASRDEFVKARKRVKAKDFDSYIAGKSAFAGVFSEIDKEHK
jgi:hypothetical protein